MEFKKFHKGETSSLDATRVAKLSALGFEWGGDKGDLKWNQHFDALKSYLKMYGNCDVPTKFANNPALGKCFLISM